ncbi:hypothetical protein N6L27_03440 [Leisingera sp. SS27]|uniref:hypothetical protein n=1 Tax=Leisingera sp. SS27 TaxID=2979462 RepID=UPI002330D47F|nr:hypothetical protein [Leisingera sp. SS27]MDC0657044.1 hypothetical protein [Leisingera sp. SS27]
MAALNVQNTRQTMDLRQQSADRQAQQFDLEMQRYAASLDSAEAAAQAEQIKKGVFAASGAQTPEEWDAIVTQFGQPDLVGQFGQKDPLLRQFMTAAQILEQQAPPKPLSGAGKVQADINAGLLPEGTPLTASGTTVNVDTGGGSKLYETLDKKQGEMFAALIEQGTQVPQNIAMVDEMERILADQNTPEGIAAALQYTAGQFGIPSEGLDSLQAAQAIINRLVPAQRQPGSGPMSDADLALFKQSLPQLINTRQGNLIIARTLRGLAQYQQGQAAIAAAVANREITPAEARKALSELENPLQAFKKMAADGKTTVGGGIDAETQSLIDKWAGD